jgi:hypothetical protein
MESTILATEFREKKKPKNHVLAPIQASKADLRMADEIQRAIDAPVTPVDTEKGP